MRTTPLAAGEPAPWFECRTRSRERFAFDTIAGRYIVLCFFGSAGDPVAAQLVRQIEASRTRFDDIHLSFFGVSVDPEDERQHRVSESLPGIRYFWDFDRAVSALYGAVQAGGDYRGLTYVLDPALRVLAVLTDHPGSDAHAASLVALLDRLPGIDPEHVPATHAPVLVLPRVFEPDFCETLVEYYGAHRSEETGFMRDVGGRTTVIVDYDHKRRRDCDVEDRQLRRACMVRIRDRLVPEIHKAFQFRATRMERYIVACYDAADEGHFRAHRDNTTKGTAHRRFAVSLFLNSGEYEGGFLRFPEYGSGLYAAPRGGAVVFSCSLLHEATVVTGGRRFMFLPFLYDDAARQIRQQNRPFLDTGGSAQAEQAAEPGASAVARGSPAPPGVDRS